MLITKSNTCENSKPFTSMTTQAFIYLESGWLSAKSHEVSGTWGLASEFSNRCDIWFVTGLLDEKWKAKIYVTANPPNPNVRCNLLWVFYSASSYTIFPVMTNFDQHRVTRNIYLLGREKNHLRWYWCRLYIHINYTEYGNYHNGIFAIYTWHILWLNVPYIYSTSQEICTRFLLCCALLWLYIDWFSHIHQAYFTGTVAI